MDFTLPVRLLIGLLFTIASVMKFPDLRKFSVIVAGYGVLPRTLVKPASYTQPVIEFAVGIWLLTGWHLLYASVCALGLMLVADLFIITALAKRKKMDDCGCFGGGIKVPLNAKKLVENIAWTLLCLFLILATL